MLTLAPARGNRARPTVDKGSSVRLQEASLLRVIPHGEPLSRRSLVFAMVLCGASSTAAPLPADGASPEMPAVSSERPTPRAVPRPRVVQGPIGELSEDDRAAARAAMQAMDPDALRAFRLRLKQATPDERADLLRAIAR
jgi:hypothetical protein